MDRLDGRQTSWRDAEDRKSYLALVAVGYFLDNAYDSREGITYKTKNFVYNLLLTRNITRYRGTTNSEVAPYLAATQKTYGRWYGGIGALGDTPDTLVYEYKIYWQL